MKAKDSFSSDTQLQAVKLFQGRKERGEEKRKKGEGRGKEEEGRREREEGEGGGRRRGRRERALWILGKND